MTEYTEFVKTRWQNTDTSFGSAEGVALVPLIGERTEDSGKENLDF